MKKLIILSFAILQSLSFAQEAKEACPMSVCPTSTCPVVKKEAKPLSVADLHHSDTLYNFSSMEMLRITIIEQAEVEGLEKDIVTAGIDSLGEKIIDENFEELSKLEDEESADIAMMKLFKDKMGNKPLKEILELK